MAALASARVLKKRAAHSHLSRRTLSSSFRPSSNSVSYRSFQGVTDGCSCHARRLECRQILRTLPLKKLDPHTVIGLREWIALPDLGVVGLRAKVDTGASTSALHATDISEFERDGQRWVRFTAHRARWCSAAIAARRRWSPASSSKFQWRVQTRYVVRTLLALGSHVWPVEFTLTCRKTMRYRLLLGSKALVDGQWLIDPSRTYIR